MKAILFFILFTFSLQAIAQESKLSASKSEKGIFVDHKVKPKENWFSVGRMYEISPKEIAAFNGLSMDKGLVIGQLLKIPMNGNNFTQNQTGVGVPIYHTVQPKEGLLKIASLYGLTLEGIKKLNGLTTDQINIGNTLIVGYNAPTGQSATATNPTTTNASNTKSLPAAEPAPVAKTPEKKNQPKTEQPVQKPVVVAEKPKEESPKPAQKVAEKSSQPKVEPKVETNEAKSTSPNMGNYFATSFVQQTKEGKEQKLENPKFGIFKSSSGWQDGKFYILMNDVVPGTIVKLTANETGKTVHAKVLGTVPPGKESEGMALRISNAAVAALGVETTGALSVVWYK